MGLMELGRLDTTVGDEFALAAAQICCTPPSAPPSAVRAIGSHGQTVLHQPRDAAPFTLQIGDPNVIAERAGIDVVADFRRRDIAAGGEGAPLMPAFHAAAFGTAWPLQRAWLTSAALPTSRCWTPTARSSDSIPDRATACSMRGREHTCSKPQDADGAWAAAGTVDAKLLDRTAERSLFLQPPPKSTGRETFSDAWLEKRPAPCLTAERRHSGHAVRADGALDRRGSAGRRGGSGARIGMRRRRLQRGSDATPGAISLPSASVEPTSACGIAPEHVEAAGFAWLAHRYVCALPGNLPAVTGARHPVAAGRPVSRRGRVTIGARVAASPDHHRPLRGQPVLAAAELHQSRTVVARVQPARAGAEPGRPGAAARAAEIPVHLIEQPG